MPTMVGPEGYFKIFHTVDSWKMQCHLTARLKNEKSSWSEEHLIQTLKIICSKL